MTTSENQSERKWKAGSGWWTSALGTVSLVLYIWIAFGLEATSELRPIFGYLFSMAGLFACYFALVFANQWMPAFALPQARTILLWAVLFRIVMLGAGLDYEDPAQGLARDLSGGETGYETFLLYDNDVWRYLWDGHLLARGESPYASTPHSLEQAYLASESESPLDASFEDDRWLEVYDNLSFTDYATVYGPAAQGLFALVAGWGRGSVLILKLVLLAFDVGICWLVLLLARRYGRPEALLAYAWNPLVIKEISGSAHVESVMVFLVVAAIWQWLSRRLTLSMVLLALAALVKFVPLVLLPVIAVYSIRERWNGQARSLLHLAPPIMSAAAVLVLGWLPFLGDVVSWSRAVRSFLAEWAFNAGPYRLIVESLELLGFDGWTLAAWPGRALLLTAVALLCVAAWRGATRLEVVFAVLAAVVWLGATVNPWYLIWALPFAVLIGCWPWLALTALSQLSYLYYLDQTERLWLIGLEHGLFLVLLVVWLRRRQPGADEAPGSLS